MPFVPNPNALSEVDRRIGGGLINVAIAVQGEMTAKLSTSYPPASTPGEYPHGRTWNLRSGIVYEPTDRMQAGRERSVRIGYTQRAHYGGILELFRDRLGLRATVQKLKGRIARFLPGATSSG